MASETTSPSSLLTDNLPLLSGAPNGIQKLRELILELAVRGKLVPQDQNDEPASELLKHIAEEKSRLVAEGIIRKQKPLLERQKEDKPFELPTGWEWSRLGEIALINPRNSAPDSTKVSFVPMTLIGTRFDGRHAQEVRTWAEVKQGFTHFAEGDIGVAKITPCFENSKACVFSDLENSLGAGTTELHIVRPVGKYLAARYVLAYLKSPQFLLVGETKMTGTAGQKRLPKDFVESNPFPLPPLAEQYRIVAKVDELMALCDRLEAQHADAESAHARLVQALLDSLTQASDADDFAASWQRLAEHFHTLFTTESSIDVLKQTLLQLAVMGKLVPQDPSDEPASELLKRVAEEKARLVATGKIKKQKPLKEITKEEMPFEKPNGWDWVRLEELAQLITKGSSPKWQGISYTEDHTDILFVTSENVGRYQLRLDSKKYVERKFNEIEPRSILSKGDFLMNIVGASIGRTAIFELDLDANINQAVCLIRCVSNLMNSQFLLYFFNSETCLSYMFNKQVDNARANLSMGNIASFVLPIPPLAEQQRIVAKIDGLVALCDQLKARIGQVQQIQEHLAKALVEQAVA
ncbi:restriction endonuclease subunit S (plasmid) [Pseudomonas luteola]